MAAPINKTTAETVISARDGETVVFAGLITKDKAVARRSVPLLGDLPGLGSLFRYDVETEKRKELLIIMTPHIVRGEEDVDRIKALETERMSWLLSDLTEIHGDTGIKEGRGFWGEPGTVIYPDDDPAGTLLDHAFPSSSMGGGLPQLETNQLQSRYMFPRSGNPRMMQAIPYNPQPPLPAPSQPAYQQRNAPVPQAPGDVSANPYLPANNVGGQRATNYTSQPQQPYNGQIRRVPPQAPQNYTTPISR